MKNIFKGKIATAIILLATFVLAGVAIFTAVRLYQLRQTSVAPNVPSSVPKAVDNTCTLSFTLTPTGSVSCESKKAYKAASSSATDFSLGSEISGGGNVSPGDLIIFVVTIKETNSGVSYTFTDTLSSKLEYIGLTSTNECFGSSSSPITCSATIDTGRASVQVKIKVKVKTAAAIGELTNTASITPGQETPKTCSVALVVATPTPTGTPTATPTATPTPTPTPTAVPQCNTTCTQNSGCPSNLICSIASGATTGNCRNASCTGESDCICATATPTPTSTVTPAGTSNPTPTPTQPALPQSGINWPTTFALGIGILTILGALLLAL